MALSLTRTTQGTTSDANSNLNNNWTALENLLNGQLDTTNLKTSTAAITAAQLAAAAQLRLLPSAPATDNVAVWNGSAWVAQKVATAQISATAGILGSQLAAAAAIAPTQLAGGTSGQVLKSVGSTPTWSKNVSLQTNTTPVDSPENTSQNELQTLTIGAAALAVGDMVRIRAGGTCSGAGGAKTLQLCFGPFSGPNTVGQFSGTNQAFWSMEAIVVVTGASAQEAVGTTAIDTSFVNALTTQPTNAISGSITVRTFGQTSSVGDEIVSRTLTVEIIPA